MDSFDTIIIGSGAGGGTIAHTLARTGRNILILERGEAFCLGERELGSCGSLSKRAI